MANADRIIDLLHEAKARPAGAEREQFLAEACRDDAALKEQIISLLKADAAEGVSDFLKSIPLDRQTILLTEKPGDRIGRYKLLEQIGEGGCGVVYMAEQEEPVRRRVALKVIKLGMDTKQVIARFEAERQALAMMDHPNIAKVLDAGATETGRPFFVMELVRGIKITDYCDQNNLPTNERLELFIQVCQAIQHAHQKGIIHRDIKPSNILVTLHDDVAVPKVIDFGIAKATIGQLTDKTVFTAFAQFIGTPAYMSPEQAQMSGLDVDTRADIYSLGVLLYELLTGHTPFDAKELLAAGMDEMRRKIREDEPAKPSTCLSTMQAVDLTTVAKRRHVEPPKLIHLIRGDLDWLVMKCLEKDRTRRYETANGLAMDIQRHLQNEPVTARPPSNLYRFQKLVRRNKLAFVAGTAILLVLLAGIAVSTWQAIRATRAEREQTGLRQQAEQARDTAKQQEQLAKQSGEFARQQELLARRRFYAAQMNLANQAAEAGRLAQTLELLETQRPRVGQEDLRSFEWYHLWGLCNVQHHLTLRGHTRPVLCLAVSSDSQTLASASQEGSVRIWEISTGREMLALKPEIQVITYSLGFTPDGTTLATGGSDNLVRLWDVGSGKLRATLSCQSSPVRCLTISPDGKNLACVGDDGVVTVWDLAAGNEQGKFEVGNLPVLQLGYAKDGTMLVSGSGWSPIDGMIKLWDLTRGPPQTKLQIASGARALALSPDGRTLATAFWEDILLWDTATGQLRTSLRGHQPPVTSLAFLPDGKTLASCALDRTVRLWQLSSKPGCNGRVCVFPARLVTAAPMTIRFSPAGGPLATAGSVTLHLGWNNWNRIVSPDPAMTFNHASNYWEFTVTIPADVTQLDCAFYNGANWDNNNSADWHFAIATNSAPLEISPENPATRSTSTNQVSLTAVTPSRSSDSSIIGEHLDSVLCLAASANGATLASGANDGSIKLWNVAASQIIGKPPVADSFWFGDSWTNVSWTNVSLLSLLFSPDGKTLIGVTEHCAVARDLVSGEAYPVLPGATGRGALSPDGKLLATGANDGTVKLWDYPNRRLLASVKAHPWDVAALAFSPDGRLLATSGTGDPVLKVWNPAAALSSVWMATTESAGVNALGFSPDGKRLAVSVRDADVLIFETSTGGETFRLHAESGSAGVLATVFSPDGKLLATGGDSGGAKLWNAETGRLHSALKGHTAMIHSIVFSPDGNTVATGSEDHTIRLWDTATGQERITLKGFHNGVRSVVFSPDGNTLAGGSIEGTVRLWRASRVTEATAYSSQPIEADASFNGLQPDQSDGQRVLPTKETP